MTEFACLSEREAVLLRPDSFLGANVPRECLTTDTGGTAPIVQKCTVPGILVHMFEEILGNATDHAERDKTMTYIKISADHASGDITVVNDGEGIPIRPFAPPDDMRWLPTVIFSEFHAGSNFNDDDSTRRDLIGRNGVGSKATFVWSTHAAVHIIDAHNGKEFQQGFLHNLSEVEEPVVRALKRKSGRVEVRFHPDYSRLGLPDGLPAAAVHVLRERAWQVAACVRDGVRVHFNGDRVPIRSTVQYARRMLDAGAANPYECATACGRASIVVCPPVSGAPHVIGFVNAVPCHEGTHVEWAKARVCAAAGKACTASLLRSACTIIVRVTVDKPAFTSQTKDRLATPASLWAAALDFTDANAKSLAAALKRLGVVAFVEQASADQALTKARRDAKSKGVRRAPIVPKYEPARVLGYHTGATLIVTEGDSAKALAAAGLPFCVGGRDKHGLFPLKGVPINVRKYSEARALVNDEIKRLLLILGLRSGDTAAEQVKALHYRHLAIFADQDPDGSHITGLVLANMQHMFPELLAACPDFLQRIVTPVVRCTHPSHGVRDFFSTSASRRFWSDHASVRGWKAEYYKGLGAWTHREAQAHFANLSELRVTLRCDAEGSTQALQLYFNPTHASGRKELLQSADYDPDAEVDYSATDVDVPAFLHREYLHFGAYAVRRAVPDARDGLKPAQRDVLWTMLQKRMTSSIKVGQLAPIVAAYTHSPHGEKSVSETVIYMAQGDPGRRNVTYVVPKGQFGCRQHAGTEHAADRYLHTHLDAVTRALFPSDDDAYLPHGRATDGMGDAVTPCALAPVVCMALVNGAKGIGWGVSTSVPSYHPLRVLEASRAYLDGGEAAVRALELVPWYDGYDGHVSVHDGVLTTRGTWSFDDSAGILSITELPIGVWTCDAFERLKSTLVQAPDDGALLAGAPLNYSTNSTVDIRLQIARKRCTHEACKKMARWGARCATHRVEGDPGTPWCQAWERLRADDSALDKMLGLTRTERVDNMHLLRANGQLQRFASPHEVLLAHAEWRLHMYEVRRQGLLERTAASERKARAKAAFLNGILQGNIAIVGVPTAEVEQALASMNFPQVDDSYHYLLHGIPLSNLAPEAVERCVQDAAQALATHEKLEHTTPADMWREDLDVAERALRKHLADKAERRSVMPAPAARASSSARGKRKR